MDIMEIGTAVLNLFASELKGRKLFMVPMHEYCIKNWSFDLNLRPFWVVH